MNKFFFQFLAPNLAFNNCRSYLTDYSWDDVRKTAVKLAGNKCTVCGISRKDEGKSLQCHEVFDIGRFTRVQKLIDFQVVCELCHKGIHYARTQRLADKKKTVLHMSKVLNITSDMFLTMFKAHRLSYNWVFTENLNFSLDLNYLGYFAKKHKLTLHTPLKERLDSKYSDHIIYGVDETVIKFYKKY